MPPAPVLPLWMEGRADPEERGEVGVYEGREELVGAEVAERRGGVPPGVTTVPRGGV
jgi:hypothetical protein